MPQPNRHVNQSTEEEMAGVVDLAPRKVLKRTRGRLVMATSQVGMESNLTPLENKVIWPDHFLAQLRIFCNLAAAAENKEKQT